ncbi:hypothetical protein C8Q75DRAFT_795891 [Abortiporus biennis]|nr:hypothetical protein C8Q75DRAFT_795891 [Abortiporus biennis]
MTSETVITFKVTPGKLVTDRQLDLCAHLFSENYGIWGANGPHPKEHIKMSPAKLRSEDLSNPERSALVTCSTDGKLVGHAFASTWEYGSDVIAWISQLVVHKDYRRRRIGTFMIGQLTRYPLFENITVLGLVSCNPIACDVLAKSIHVGIGNIDTKFIADNAFAFLVSSHIPYLKGAKLHGSIFGKKDAAEGVVSTVDTNFAVDHTETDAVLKTYLSQGKWCLGRLPENHEFLIMLPITARCG